MIKVANKNKTVTKTKAGGKKTTASKSNHQLVNVIKRENITEYSLPNGLKVLLLPNDSAPVVTCFSSF